jgi:hypothetical protein
MGEGGPIPSVQTVGRTLRNKPKGGRARNVRFGESPEGEVRLVGEGGPAIVREWVISDRIMSAVAAYSPY